MMKNRSIDILQKKMEPKGFTFEDLLLGTSSRRYTRITSPSGNMLIMKSGQPLYPFATSAASTIYQNKEKLYDLAQLLQLQIPRTIVLDFSHWQERRSELVRLLKESGAVIVKPDNSFGSRGLSLDLTTMDAIEVAIEHAGSVSNGVLVQQQFYGEELRFAVIGGEVKAVLLRQKPVVVGDGSSTIAQLIDKENKLRAAITETVVAYPLLDESLINREFLASNRVVAKDEQVELSRGTMIRNGASVYDITNGTHPGYIAAVEKLASQFGPGFIAVDLMVADYAQQPTENNYVILEINANPALSMFYSCRDGKHAPIVETYLLDAIERAIDG